MIDNSSIALLKAYQKSSNLFHEKVTPNLPEHIQHELEKCESFTCYFEGKDKKVVLLINKKEFDITQWWVPGITIFDSYEYEKIEHDEKIA